MSYNFGPQMPTVQPLGLLQAFQQGAMNNANIQGQQLNNQTAQTNLQTLGQLNQAKLKGLDLLNQQTVAGQPYWGQNAASQALLQQEQAQFYPQSQLAALLNGAGRAGFSVRPGAAYIGLPKPLADQLAANNVQGQSNIGAINNPNMGFGNGLASVLQGALNRAAPNLGQMGISSQNGTQITPKPSIQDDSMLNGANNQNIASNQQPLPLSPTQQNTLAQMFGHSQQSPSSQSLQGDQAAQVANQLRTSAANSVAAPAMQQKYNYATNLLSTLTKYGNPAVTFAEYMSPAGYAQYAKDLAAQKPQAINFSSFLKNIGSIGPDQIRQYFSTSVQPHVLEDLRELTDPRSLKLGAAGSAKTYDDLMDILRQEGGQSAISVGKQDEFNNRFPTPDASYYLNNINTLKQKGANGKTYFQTLSPNVQPQIIALHRSRKGESNGS